MCWPWWMPTRLPPGGRTDAESEPGPFRSGDAVCAAHVRGDGRGDQTERPRPVALRHLRFLLLCGGAVRNRLADVSGAPVEGLPHRRDTETQRKQKEKFKT